VKTGTKQITKGKIGEIRVLLNSDITRMKQVSFQVLGPYDTSTLNKDSDAWLDMDKTLQ